MMQLKPFCYVIALTVCAGAQAAFITSAVASPAAAAHASLPLSSSGMTAAGGRVLTMFTHPVLPNKLWAGTAYAGLWQSSDAGTTWLPASDLMKNLAVGALATDPGNPETMYVGTGEGGSNQPAQRGRGMFKSEDGGANWTLLPLTSPARVGENWSHINSIAVSSAGVILVATSDNDRNGFIYRSSDGGDTWGLLPVYAASKVGPHNMIHKVRFDPANPGTALFMDDYANITHSVDGGLNWTIVKKSSTCQ